MRKTKLMMAVVFVVLVFAVTFVACGDNGNDNSTNEIVIRIHDGDNVIRWNRDEDFPTIKKDGYHISALLDAPNGESIDLGNLLQMELTSDFDVYIVWQEHQYSYVAPTQPTCTEPGYASNEMCFCGEYRTPRVVTAAALGHNYVHFEKVEPTCLKDGREACDVCSRCEDYNVIATIIPATGTHIATDACKCASCGEVYHANINGFKCEKCNATVFDGHLMPIDIIKHVMENEENVQVSIGSSRSKIAFGYDDNGIYITVMNDQQITSYDNEKNIIKVYDGKTLKTISATVEEWNMYRTNYVNTMWITVYDNLSDMLKIDFEQPMDFVQNKYVANNNYPIEFSFNNDFSDYSKTINKINGMSGTETYLVILDANGGKFEYGEGDLTYSNDYDCVIINERTTGFSSPKKQNYNFVDWYEDLDFTVRFDDVKNITKSTTLYARWN